MQSQSMPHKCRPQTKNRKIISWYTCLILSQSKISENKSYVLITPPQDARDIPGELKFHCESVEDVHLKGTRAESNYCQVRDHMLSFMIVSATMTWKQKVF